MEDSVFIGFGKDFSTQDDKQYIAIGDFWDYMSERFGRENLQGLGCHWTPTSIEYVIGLKEGSIDINSCDKPFPGTVLKSIDLPVEGWNTYKGRTENLAEMYDQIYKDGPLTFEIETFNGDGTCEVRITRTIEPAVSSQ